jgi:hypothetical protein
MFSTTATQATAAATPVKIPMSLIQDLRNRTGAGVTDCKKGKRRNKGEERRRGEKERRGEERRRGEKGKREEERREEERLRYRAGAGVTDCKKR